MSFMAQREGERDRNNDCLGMAGGSKNYDVICNQYLCDFYILETGVLVLGLSSEAVLETFLEGQEREVRDAVVDLLPSVSVLYQFVQVNLG